MTKIFSAIVKIENITILGREFAIQQARKQLWKQVLSELLNAPCKSINNIRLVEKEDKPLPIIEIYVEL